MIASAVDGKANAATIEALVTAFGQSRRRVHIVVGERSRTKTVELEAAPETLASLLAGRSGNIKTVLTDQSVLAGVGNAYSDEALHAAKLSPFKPAGKLTPEEVAHLHQGLISVLSDAV